MSKWEEKKFKEFIKLNRGFDLPNDKMKFGNYPVVASTNIKGYHISYKVTAPVVVTGRSGSLGVVQYIDKNCTPLNTTLYVKDFKGNFPRFVYYYLKTMRLDTFNSGAGVPTLNQNHLHSMKINIPDIPTQECIADILSAYDDLIEANNRRIELLEQAAQELYKEWFVRFRFPGHEKAKFENGLPEGWTVKRIGDLFQITSSKRVYLADYVENGIPFYRSKEVIQLSQGQAITEPLYISNATFQNFKNKFGAPEENDILITSVGTIGISYLVDGHEFYFKDGNLTWIKSGSDKILSLFLFQWLNSQGGKQQLHQSTIGTSQSALTIENLKKIKLIVPDKKLVEDYYNKTYDMIEKKRILQKNNQNLTAQRDLLLPRLMSGKLEV
ncbi:restriction endonuclease subunit S [Mordavella massiliensis]|uniref:restriction endonuclease subunit S n=1 Tax=Mordavella massiliensis TaxID=1871024 RepID=UPI00210E2DB4|nr:restriction endonuclease subunit S [Mordavella massiliensis]